MNKTISLSEYLSVLVLHLKEIIIAILIGGILLGGLQLGKSILTSPKAAETDNSDDVITQSIQLKERQLASQQEYLKESLYMKLDGEGTQVSMVIFSFQGFDSSAMTFDQESSALVADKLIPTIAEQYLLLWRLADLPEVLALPKYKDVQDKYLRELFSVSFQNNLLLVQAYSDDLTDANQMVNAAKNYLLMMNQSVSEALYQHELTVIESSTKERKLTNITEKQQEQITRVTTLQSEISELKKQLSTAPQNRTVSISSILIYALIGCLLGFFLSVLFIILLSTFKSTLRSENQLSRDLEINYLGSVKIPDGSLEKCAFKLAGNRVWQFDEEMLSYAVSSTLNRTFGKKTLLLSSSLSLTEAQVKALQPYLEKLKEHNLYIILADHFLYNKAAIDSLLSVDSVILAESVNQSKSTDILAIKQVLSQQDIPLAGFITL